MASDHFDHHNGQGAATAMPRQALQLLSELRAVRLTKAMVSSAL